MVPTQNPNEQFINMFYKDISMAVSDAKNYEDVNQSRPGFEELKNAVQDAVDSYTCFENGLKKSGFERIVFSCEGLERCFMQDSLPNNEYWTEKFKGYKTQIKSDMTSKNAWIRPDALEDSNLKIAVEGLSALLVLEAARTRRENGENSSFSTYEHR